jgi:NAD(P)-dependent dehydrogenase (short-subunit alcohol dehydrogenase family)
MKKKRTWFVTGASKGFGLSLVRQLLERGENVAATSRNMDDLEENVGVSDRFLGLAVDLKNEASVSSAIKQTVEKFGRVDVVVNNAGFGLLGSLEELADEEVRGSFDINVFGALNVIRHAVPYLRKQKSGNIFNISSVGGFSGTFAGWGIYCATKFAVQGFTEALSMELKEFGVHVTDVAPGYFRTNFLSSDSMVVSKRVMSEYTDVRASQDLHQNKLNGKQQGDPEKAVAVIIDVASSPNPPLHLFLGEDAYELVYKKMDAIKSDLENWRELATATAINENAEAHA